MKLGEWMTMEASSEVSGLSLVVRTHDPSILNSGRRQRTADLLYSDLHFQPQTADLLALSHL